MPSQRERLTFRAPAHLQQQINARGRDESDSIRESLGRYYYLLAQARAELREMLTGPELALLCDAHNGAWWTPESLGVIRWSAEDADPEYFEKWGVERAVLVDKLRVLTPLQCAALVDAIERYWKASSTDMPVNPERILEK